MKVKSQLAKFTGACAVLVLALALPANAADKGWYFNADAGANWAMDTKSDGEDVEFDIGYRFGAGVGYNLNKSWGIEFDTGWTWNAIDKVGGFSLSGDSSLSHIPLMVNAVYRFPLGAKFESYIGGGVGGTYSVLTIDEPGLDDDDSDIVFAWQAIAGVRYLLSETMSVGVGYKYLGASETEYDIQGAGNISLDTVHNHTFGAVFNWKF